MFSPLVNPPLVFLSGGLFNISVTHTVIFFAETVKYGYDPSTENMISNAPLLADPYEQRLVCVQPSTLKYVLFPLSMCMCVGACAGVLRVCVVVV